MAKWASSISGKKIDNHKASLPGKLELRQKLLAAIPEPSVFDGFRATGVIAGRLYTEAVRYVCCDEHWHPDGRAQFVCDNRRLLRHLDLADFNLFDFDAYGSPWPQVEIVTARRKLLPDEVVGLALTDGSAMKATLGGVEASLARLAGVDRRMRGAYRDWQALTIMALRGAAKRMGATVDKFWIIDLSKQRKIVYSAALLRGHGPDENAVE